MPDTKPNRDESQPAGRRGAAASPRTQPRTNDPERTQEDIIATATVAFARDGLNGSRVDEIAELMHTSKRMIYYYYNTKEGLYQAVLERSYEHIRQQEALVHLEDLPPEEALVQLVRFTFDYHIQNEDFVRLVMVENIHRAKYLHEITSVKDRARYAINTLRKIIDDGMKSDVFRDDIDPLDLHMTISALCFYNVSNRATVAHVFDHDMAEASNAARRREIVVQSVLAICRKG